MLRLLLRVRRLRILRLLGPVPGGLLRLLPVGSLGLGKPLVLVRPTVLVRCGTPVRVRPPIRGRSRCLLPRRVSLRFLLLSVLSRPLRLLRALLPLSRDLRFLPVLPHESPPLDAGAARPHTSSDAQRTVPVHARDPNGAASFP